MELSGDDDSLGLVNFSARGKTVIVHHELDVEERVGVREEKAQVIGEGANCDVLVALEVGDDDVDEDDEEGR